MTPGPYGSLPAAGPPGFAARLVELAEELRAEGVAAGTAELLDAFAALREVPWTEAEDVREALAATLAKSPDDRRIFELVFDRFLFRAAEVAAVREGVREGERAAATGSDADGEAVDLDELRRRIAEALRAGDEGALRDLARLALAAFGRRGDGSGVIGVDVQRIRRALGLRADAQPDLPEDDPRREGLPRDGLRRFEALLRRELERAQIERTQVLPPKRPLTDLDRALPSGPLQDLAAVHRVVAQLKRRLATQGHEAKGHARVPGDRPARRREVPLLREDVGHLGDALDEDEGAHLAERVVQRVEHAEEEHRRARDARRDVAEHEDLRAPRPHGPGLDHDGHAAGLQRRSHRAAHVDVHPAPRAALLLALRLEPPLELRDDEVHRGEVLERAARQRAVELVQRPGGRQLLRALDLVALELAAEHRLEAPQLLARDAVAARVVLGQVGLRVGAQAERAADALHVDADHPAALAPPERRDGQPGEVAHRALRAVAQRGGDLLAQRVEVRLAEVGQVHALAVALLAHPLAHRGLLGGAEEEAVEDELEHAPVVGRLGQRRGERLAEHLRLGPADVLERGERVEQRARADRDALGAQLLAEAQESLSQWQRAA